MFHSLPDHLGMQPRHRQQSLPRSARFSCATFPFPHRGERCAQQFREGVLAEVEFVADFGGFGFDFPCAGQFAAVGFRVQFDALEMNDTSPASLTPLWQAVFALRIGRMSRAKSTSPHCGEIRSGKRKKCGMPWKGSQKVRKRISQSPQTAMQMCGGDASCGLPGKIREVLTTDGIFRLGRKEASDPMDSSP